MGRVARRSRTLTRVFMLLSAVTFVAADTNTKQYPELPFSSDFGGSFKLTDHTGQVVTDKDYHGQFVILYFGYTACADVCPMALYSIGRALKKIEPISNNITPLFINLDPKRNDLDIMAQYVQYFHPRFIGLTGSERAIKNATGSYGVRYRYIQHENGSTSIEHSGKIFLIGPDGEVLTYFPHEASVDWISTVTERHVRAGLEKVKGRE